MRRLAIVAVLLGSGAMTAAGADKDGRVTIRAVHKEGQLLQYRLKLSGAAAWTPSLRDIQWGRMTTDFLFTLRGKTLRETGACTYELLGHQLNSVGEGPKGKFVLRATPKSCSLRFNNSNADDVSAEGGPLARPMTATFGPRWNGRFGTGLLPVAPYLLPGMDKTFLRHLTTAPLKPVKPGDTWSTEFDLAAPGGKGRPLKVKAQWEVTGWKTLAGRKVLVISKSAKLTMADSNLLLRNGDTIHVVSGKYTGHGTAYWDVEGGRLVAVSAAETLLAKADKPEPRALRGESKVDLKLLRYQAPAPK